MRGSQPITLTASEVAALADYAATQPQARTFRLQRDTRHVLLVIEPNGKLTRLTPDTGASSA